MLYRVDAGGGSTDSTLYVRVPAGLAVGATTVSLSTCAGAATTTLPFTIDASPDAVAPLATLVRAALRAD